MVADALSNSHLLAIQAISEVQPLWVQEVLNSYTTDSMAQDILTRLAVKSPDEQGFSLHQGIIKYKDKYGLLKTQPLGQRSLLLYIPQQLEAIQGLKKLITG